MILDYFSEVKNALNRYKHLISDLSSTEKIYSDTYSARSRRKQRTLFGRYTLGNRTKGCKQG